jgi:hypothetical protein
VKSLAAADRRGVSRTELIRELIDRALGGHPGADLAAINNSFGILSFGILSFGIPARQEDAPARQ